MRNGIPRRNPSSVRTGSRNRRIAFSDEKRTEGKGSKAYTLLSTIIFLISAMAFAGFRPFGQAWVQFMMVWHR